MGARKTRRPFRIKAIAEQRYRRAAERLYEDEGTIEVDGNAPVSCGEPGRGAYVQAWVWVPVFELQNEKARETSR